MSLGERRTAVKDELDWSLQKLSETADLRERSTHAATVKDLAITLLAIRQEGQA